MDNDEIVRMIGIIAGAQLAWDGVEYILSRATPSTREQMEYEANRALDAVVERAEKEHAELLADNALMKVFLESVQSEHVKILDRIISIRAAARGPYSRSSRILAR